MGRNILGVPIHNLVDHNYDRATKIAVYSQNEILNGILQKR